VAERSGPFRFSPPPPPICGVSRPPGGFFSFLLSPLPLSSLRAKRHELGPVFAFLPLRVSEIEVFAPIPFFSSFPIFSFFPDSRFGFSFPQLAKRPSVPFSPFFFLFFLFSFLRPSEKWRSKALFASRPGWRSSMLACLLFFFFFFFFPSREKTGQAGAPLFLFFGLRLLLADAADLFLGFPFLLDRHRRRRHISPFSSSSFFFFLSFPPFFPSLLGRSDLQDLQRSAPCLLLPPARPASSFSPLFLFHRDRPRPIEQASLLPLSSQPATFDIGHPPPFSPFFFSPSRSKSIIRTDVPLSSGPLRQLSAKPAASAYLPPPPSPPLSQVAKDRREHLTLPHSRPRRTDRASFFSLSCHSLPFASSTEPSVVVSLPPPPLFSLPNRKSIHARCCATF